MGAIGIVKTPGGCLPMNISERWLMDACRSLRSIEIESAPEPLIPGLPDDISYQCLLRVPLESHSNMTRVCSQWRRVIEGQSFYRDRLQNRLEDNWICGLIRDNKYRNSIRAFDTRSKAWIELPPMPDNRHGRAVGQEYQVVAGKIIICGGWRDRPLDSVTIFDPRHNRWTPGPPMLSPRAHFVSGVIGDRLYVAGGGNGQQPRSQAAEYYDSLRNKWYPIPSLDVGISFCLGLSMTGKLFVQARGGVPTETQVFLPDFNLWSAFKSNMLAWPHRPHAALGDRLYRADIIEGRHELMAYDPDLDEWKSLGPIVNGPRRRIHEIVGMNGKLWAISDDLSVGLLEFNAAADLPKVKFVNFVGGAPSAERLICCNVLVV
eukprot:Gb_07972 [translate_table: standard]